MSQKFSYEDALTPPNAGGAFSYEDASGEKPKRTWGEAIKDTGAQLAEGVNTTLGAIPSVVAPQSKAAGFFRDNAEHWRDQQSDVLKGRIAETDKRIQEAGKDGVMSQIGAAASEYWNDPAQAARLVATNLPSMAATLGTGAAAGFAAKGVAAARGMDAAGKAALAAKYGTTTAAATNAALNAGGARGEAFEDLQKTALSQGMSPEQAEQAGVSGSILPGVVGGVAGAISGKMGLEKALLGQATAGAATRKAAGAFGAELAGEQIEELAPKVATNYQVGQLDAARGLTDDLGRTMVETAIGSGPGAVVAGGAAGMRAGDPPPTDPGPVDPTTSPGAADPSAPVPPGAAPVEAPEAPDLTTSPGAGVARDGMDFTREVDTSGLSLQDPAELERARAATVNYQPGDTTPQWETSMGAAAARQGLDMPAPEFDADGLGLDPIRQMVKQAADAGGALSTAAGVALDLGATNAQFLGATGRDVQLRQTGPGVTDESNIIDVDAREVPDQRGIPTARRLTNDQGGALATASQTLALPAPTNLREGLERIRAQKQEAANAQAAQAPAPAAAPAPGPTTAAAVEANGVAPQASIQAITAKQIPDMTDAELQAAIVHYGPAHKRTAKLQAALDKRQGSVGSVRAHSVGSQSIGLEHADNSAAADAERVANFSGAKAGSKQLLNRLDADDLASMERHVLRVAQHPEIFNAVVKLIPVNVMNMLRRQQLTPEILFGNPTMLTNGLVGGNSDHPVTIPVDAATAVMRAVASVTAKDLAIFEGGNSRRLPIDAGATSGTRKVGASLGGIVYAGASDSAVPGAALSAAKDVGSPVDQRRVPDNGGSASGTSNSNFSSHVSDLNIAQAKKQQKLPEGDNLGTTSYQTQQAAAQPAQAGPAQPAQGLTDAAAAQNPGAQGTPAPGAQAQTQGAAWDGLDPQQRTAVLSKAGWITNKGGLNVIGKRLLNTSWEQITGGTREIIARNIENEQGVAATAGVQEPPSRTPEATALRLGRDSTPLSEGGKPFKTRKAAGDAKKQQPMMRVVTVPGGFALAEKTPAQLAAEAKAARRLAQPRTGTAGEPLAAHEFIAAEGGLSSVAAADLGVDGSPRIGNRRLFAGRGRGMSMEQAAEKLIADGYLGEGATINDAYNLIKLSLSRPQYNADGIERIAEAEVQTRFDDYLAAQEEAAAEGDADPFGMAGIFTTEELDDVGYTDADPALQAEVSALIAQAEALGIDTYDILEDIARTHANSTQDQYNAAARDALAEAIARSNQDGGGTSAQAAPAAEPAADQELDQPEALELASQTPAEAAAQQDAVEQAAKAEAARQRAADAQAARDEERKRIAQASVRAAAEFELGQDPLDSLTGQGSMFDDAPAQQTTTQAAADDDGRERFTLSIEMFGDVPYIASKPVDAGSGEVVSSRVITTKTKLTAANAQALGLPKDKGTLYAWRVSVIRRANGETHSVIEAMATDNGRSPDGEVLAHFKEVENPEAMERIAPAIANAALADWRAAQPQQAPTATETVVQPTTRADVTAAQQQAATLIGERIDAMTAGEVNTIARRFLPTMGVKPTVSKERNKAAMLDQQVNLQAAADELGAILPADVKRALQADMEGRVADAATDNVAAGAAPASAAPVATELTPKQFHEAKLAFIAADTGTPLAEVRENYDTEAGRAEHNREWAAAVEEAAKGGQSLTRQTLDKLFELAPNARLPESAIPDGYQRPEARKAETEEKQARADNRKKANAGSAIEDAGEKIGGARKDRWKERGLNLDDLDAMTEAEGAELATKANVWKPDYDALAEATEPVTAAMVKTIYDQLAAKPKKNTPEGRRQYVQMMRIVRDVLTEAKGPDAVRNAYLEIRKRAGLNTMDPKAKEVARGLLFSVYKGRSDPFVLGGADLMKAKKMVEDGFPAKAAPWKSRLTVGRREGGNGVTERGIEMYMELSADVGTPLSREQIEAGFFRVVDKQNKTVAFAPTKEDAEAAAETVYERDLKGKKDSKPEPVRPNLDELKRENLPRRIDRDVTADDFVKDLGFRGIEFGLWSAQDERQRILNMAYDGLMDLAEIMGVPPKAMSLNGTLGMAFGARGGGRFAAHYEPGKLVINMTKIRGGGSMAHEWAHALDHYFGELDKADAYTTQARGASGWYAEDQYVGVPRKRMERVGNEWKSVEKMRLDNLRPEMAAAFDEVMRALFSKQITKAEMVRSHELDLERTEALARKEQQAELKAMYQNMAQNKREALNELRNDPEGRLYAGRGRSDYAKQAQALSGKSVDGYWVRPTEMFARAFESWVFDRVTAMGARSDYLVHGVEEDRFAGGGYKGNPYPTGEERARINAAFDKLTKTIKTKETDTGNVAMFSRTPATKAAYEARIDALYAGGKPLPHGVRVLDRSDMLGLLGMGSGPVHLVESKVEKGRFNHGLSAADWKKVPGWLDDPAMVFDSETQPGRLVFIAPEMVNGSPVRMIVDPRPDGQGVNLLVNAYDADRNPFQRWERDGLMRYFDQQKAPSVTGSFQPRLTGLPGDRGRNKILTEKHLGGYRRANTPAAFMGQSAPPADSNARNVATLLLVDGLKAKWTRAPEIIVARNMQDTQIPQAVRDYDATLKSQGASGEARGFIYKGKVYLLSDQLKGPQQIAEVLFHEVLGHYGLRGVFGKGLDSILQQMSTMRRKEVVAKAREYGLFDSDALGGLDKKAASDAQIWAAMSPKDRLSAAEEVLAEMAQTQPNIGFVQRAIAAIRNWLRAHVPGFERMRLTDADIVQAYILPARGYVTRSNETAQQAIDRAMTAFSRSSEPVSSGAPDRQGDGMEVGDDIQPAMFSRAAVAGKAAGDAIKSVTVTNIKKKAGFKLTDYLGLGLQALGRRQIVDIYGDMLPLAEYNTLVAQMEADKNEGGAEADQLVKRWAELPDEAKLADLMHDATLAQIDPDKPYVDGDDKAAHMMLQGRFKALSDDAKAVYRATRDAYQAHHAKVRSAIKERIERSELKGPRKAELLKQMDDEFFAAVKGVYFPLARFGQYAVTVKGADGKVESVSRAETKAEAETLRNSLLSAFPRDKGFTVGRVMLSKDFIADRDAVGRGFMTELYQVLDKQDMDAAQRAELEDTLGQLYLSSLPDLSWAKHGIHRKGTPGFSQDARRAYAQNMFHGSRYLAKLRYSDLMQDELTAMQKHVDDWREVEDFDQNSAQRVVDEMNKRHESLMNPKSNPLSTALTSLGFVFHLGLSPASAMVNLSQTALVAYPIMGAKWGFGKASAALLKASAEAAKGKNDITASLNADELAAYNEAVRAGTIDVTMAHDLAGIAQGEDAGVMWKIRPVMRWASFLFHHAERFNRQVTFVASYRLAREAGADQKAAFEQATKATYDGHFDYGAANRPRVMQGNVAKVLLLFKQYGQNMVYTLSRSAYQSIKGTDAEKAEARKVLAGLLTSHAMAAGVLGLPMVTTLLAAASMIGGDEDEPWDAQTALQNMLADAFGQKPAEVLAHGLSRLTPWDISGRVGLDRLIFPDVQEGLEGQRLAESAMAAALGPVAGIGVNVLKGAQHMSEGRFGLGLEAMLPSALRGPVKAIRYANEGVQDKSGISILDEVGPAAVAGQALGFSPSQARNAQEGKSAVMAHDRALGERRQELLTRAARASMTKDSEALDDARKEIARFNEKNPGRRINPNHIMQSVHNRQKRIDQAQDGVYLPKSRRDAMQAGRFAFAESE